MISSCGGTNGGTNGGAERDSKGNLQLVGETNELPTCTEERENYIYYVKKSKSLQVCNGEKYEDIGLKNDQPAFKTVGTNNKLPACKGSTPETTFYVEDEKKIYTCKNGNFNHWDLRGEKGEPGEKGEIGKQTRVKEVFSCPSSKDFDESSRVTDTGDYMQVVSFSSGDYFINCAASWTDTQFMDSNTRSYVGFFPSDSKAVLDGKLYCPGNPIAAEFSIQNQEVNYFQTEVEKGQKVKCSQSYP